MVDTTSSRRTWWDTPSYDFMDRVTSVRKGSGYTTVRTFAPKDGTLTNISTKAGGTTLQNLGFGYDELGNLKQRSSGPLTETFQYDVLNRLTLSGEGSTSYDGNIMSKTLVDGRTSSYGYSTSRPHAVTSAFGYSLSYDPVGNVNTRSSGSEMWQTQWSGWNMPRYLCRTDFVSSFVPG